MRPLLFALLVFAFSTSSCAPGHGRSAPSAPMGPPQTPLSQIRDEPGRFRGSAVRTTGRLETSGTAPEGTWMELLPPEGGAPLVVVLTAATEPGALDSWRGKTLELGLHVDGPVILADGRRGVRAMPMEVMTRIEPVSSTAMPKELEQHLKELPRQAARQRADLFRDPGFPSFASDAPVDRYSLLDPDLRSPVWTRPGAVAVERSGPPEAPEYVYRVSLGSDDGARQDVICRFRVERGKLRSVTYDEVVRDPAGKVTHEEHLDFIAGEGYDRLSGKTYPWPRNVYAAPCLPFAIAGFPLGKASSVSFWLWSDWDAFTPFDVALDGVERITVPAGTFDSARLRMNLNRERLVGTLALPMPQAYDMARDAIDQMTPPDTIFWIAAGEPHLVLRRQGLLGPPGTSRSLVERVGPTDVGRTTPGSGRATNYP